MRLLRQVAICRFSSAANRSAGRKMLMPTAQPHQNKIATLRRQQQLAPVTSDGDLAVAERLARLPCTIGSVRVSNFNPALCCLMSISDCMKATSHLRQEVTL
mmetsp:Transcript_63368/g.125327  ORF Transcript_63368/g.125327 Transcript_63368/m.125327 type:complete len:102 (-) Transcript_63368:247-552(-)